MEISKTFTVEAAHRLPNVSPDNKCWRLHGHSFRIDVAVTGKVDRVKGWVMDYGDIKQIFQPLFEMLDHHYLNEVQGLENPTSENLARWVWDRLKPDLPQLSRVVVHETCTTTCEYRGEDE